MTERKRRHWTDPPVTHHATWDSPGDRTAPALCGRYIRRVESVPEPTCPACQQLLAQRETQEP